MITSHRIIWGRPGAIPLGQVCLTLHLRYVIFIEEESPSAFSFSRSRKIILHLTEPSPGNYSKTYFSTLKKKTSNIVDRNEGPQPTSSYDFIKLSFKEGFTTDVVSILNDCIQKKKWDNAVQNREQQASGSKPLPQIKLRTGIVGIERSLQEKQKATDESISIAFQDLSKLMTMAKDMVNLSRSISTKIRVYFLDIFMTIVLLNGFLCYIFTNIDLIVDMGEIITLVNSSF